MTLTHSLFVGHYQTMVSREIEPWVVSTAKQPLAFAQVREDPLVDLALVEKLGRNLSVVMVASGGCTACALAASGRVERLHLVDINLAQLALTRLKLSLLQDADSELRCRLLGYLELDPDRRREAVEERLRELGIEPEVFGDPALWAFRGLDQSGRYELLFEALRERLSESGFLDRGAFRAVMRQENLETLFGVGATGHRARDFGDHFFTQTKAALLRDREMKGPFLSQMLRGRFSGRPYLWLESDRVRCLPELAWHQAPMKQVLAEAPDDSADLIHLSNILDWLSPPEAVDVLAEAERVLRPGGLLVLRQLNSTMTVRRLAVKLEWLEGYSEQLHRLDQSFFYRELHIGRKPE